MKQPCPAPLAPSKLPIDFWPAVMAAPYQYDLFQLLRRIDAQAGQPSLLGRATHPREEPLRLGQEPSLCFAPSTVAKVEPRPDSALHELSIYSFGLFGPNGPLPLHLTEYVRERVHHHQDRALLAFCNLFHHRLTLLLYRAWANAQASASLDRPGHNRFEQYIASLIGLGCTPPARLDSVGRHAKYHMASHLTRQVRNLEGLQKILFGYFKIPVRIIQNIPIWLPIPRAQQIRLQNNRHQGRLGLSTILGIAVRDIQHKFRIELGPLPLSTYNKFLPGGEWLHKLRDWIFQYIGIEFTWDLRLILEKKHGSFVQLGSQQRLGLNSWLRPPNPANPAYTPTNNQLTFTPDPVEQALHRPVGHPISFP